MFFIPDPTGSNEEVINFGSLDCFRRKTDIVKAGGKEVKKHFIVFTFQFNVKYWAYDSKIERDEVYDGIFNYLIQDNEDIEEDEN